MQLSVFILGFFCFKKVIGIFHLFTLLKAYNFGILTFVFCCVDFETNTYYEVKIDLPVLF